MDIRQNVSLKDYSTMRLGGTAAYMVDVTDRFQVPQAVAWAFLTIIAAATISGLIVRRQLDRLDLVAVLKSRE